VDIAEITDVRIGIGYRHGKQAVLIDCIIEDPEDIQTAEYIFPAGITAIPSVGDQVIICEISPEFLVATATNSGITMVQEQGELALYSIDSGTIKATIKLLTDGTISLNNGDSSATKFESLKDGFDQLTADFNDFVDTYNLHTHVVASGTAAKVVAPFIADKTDADIDSAKSESIRV